MRNPFSGLRLSLERTREMCISSVRVARSALVRQIVKLSGGRLGVQSKVGEGSTFWVELRAYPGLPWTVVCATVAVAD